MAQIVDRIFPQYLSRNEFTRNLVEDNGLYKLTLTLRQGQILVNGNPWHLPTRPAVTLESKKTGARGAREISRKRFLFKYDMRTPRETSCPDPRALLLE